MKLNKDLCELIAELEYIVGSECYNPNSYDGWNDVEGCSFRYPINVPNSEGKYEKTRSNINIIYKVTVKSTTVLLSTLRRCGKRCKRVLSSSKFRYPLTKAGTT